MRAISDAVLEELERREQECAANEAIDRETSGLMIEIPAKFYKPHAICQRSPQLPQHSLYDRKGKPSGQLQFHQSTHAIRLMAPGNGWGGTTAMACEVDAWCRHTRRWQPTPIWPIRAVWFCPEFRQFDIVRKNLEEVAFGRSAVFTESKLGGPRYVWPDGSTMWLCSYDRTWDHIQGIELDLAAFDEQPPPELWRELQMRRRGKRKTRYVCKATQTKGWSWMAEELYLPWKKHHEQQGIGEEEDMMLRQLHPRVWCWPRGGVHDNHGCDAQDDLWYESQVWTSKKEHKVRTFGGFESWQGDCIFDEQGLDRLRARQRVLMVEARSRSYPRSGSFSVRSRT